MVPNDWRRFHSHDSYIRNEFSCFRRSRTRVLARWLCLQISLQMNNLSRQVTTSRSHGTLRFPVELWLLSNTLSEPRACHIFDCRDAVLLYQTKTTKLDIGPLGTLPLNSFRYALYVHLKVSWTRRKVKVLLSLILELHCQTSQVSWNCP